MIDAVAQMNRMREIEDMRRDVDRLQVIPLGPPEIMKADLGHRLVDSPPALPSASLGHFSMTGMQIEIRARDHAFVSICVFFNANERRGDEHEPTALVTTVAVPRSTWDRLRPQDRLLHVRDAVLTACAHEVDHWLEVDGRTMPDPDQLSLPVPLPDGSVVFVPSHIAAAYEGALAAEFRP